MCGGLDPHRLTLWEWQAITWNWNDRHSPDEGADKDMPDPEHVKRSLDQRKARVVVSPHGGPAKV